MNLTKDYLRSLIIEEMNKQINEATEEEIGYLNDLLEVPLSALPFHDIFGDKYRILSSFKSDNPDNPLLVFERFLESTGWRFNPDNMGEVIKSINTSYIAKPEDGIQKRTKEEKLSLVKWINELSAYLDKLSNTMQSWATIIEDMREYAENTFERNPRQPKGGFKKEYLKDKNYLNMFRRRLALKKSIMKFLPPDASMRIFADIGKVRWNRGEETANDIEDFFKISSVKQQVGLQQQWLMGNVEDAGTKVKNYEFFAGKNLDEYKASLGEDEYVVFSRHPIDVFRMSDHQGLESCHTLPSSRDKLGASPSEPVWDQYNICALSEAHANGMIAYALNPDEFEEAPTQELLDQYEDGELFLDDERGIDGFVPMSRLRIKNVAFLEDKGDYSNIKTRFAVPDYKTYGDTIPGFKRHVSKVLATAQKSKIEDIVDSFQGSIDRRRFLRVGGSYQDQSMNAMLPDFFSEVLERDDIEYTETVQYSNDLEQSLKDEYQGMNIDAAKQVLQGLVEEYNGSYVNFENLDVEEDWNGSGFYMTGEVRVIYNYAEEIEYVAGKYDVQELMEEAIDYASETYFYDDNWFKDYSVMFDTFWGGYKNVMIISIDISNFSPEDNFDYMPFSPDTWMYAISEMKDKLSHVMDPHVDDSLNNTIKDYISFRGKPTTVRTDVSEKYFLSRFKEALDEDNNWDINEEEVDDDNPLGFEVLTSFTAEIAESIDLTVLFGEINEDFDPDNPELVEQARKLSAHIATLVSILASEDMNILKAGLLDEQFYNNQSLYSGLSQATKINELDMKVVASIGWGDEDISPETILQGIANDKDLELSINITCEDWSAVDIETIGNMMLGKFKDNNGWHIDSDQNMVALVNANVQVTRPSQPQDIQEIIRKEILNLL